MSEDEKGSFCLAIEQFIEDYNRQFGEYSPGALDYQNQIDKIRPRSLLILDGCTADDDLPALNALDKNGIDVCVLSANLTDKIQLNDNESINVKLQRRIRHEKLD